MIMNNASKLGLFLGCLGGIVAIIGLAISYTRDVSTVTTLGILLLVAVMYFSLGGGFTKNSQWTPKALTFYGFLTLAVVLAFGITEFINVYIVIAEIVIAVLIITVSYSPATKRFISQE